MLSGAIGDPGPAAGIDSIEKLPGAIGWARWKRVTCTGLAVSQPASASVAPSARARRRGIRDWVMGSLSKAPCWPDGEGGDYRTSGRSLLLHSPPLSNG